MKNIFSIFKKPEATQNETVPFIPTTRVLRESITAFIVQSLQPYVDEKSLSVGGLHFYIVCANAQQEEAVRVALCTDKPGMFKSEYLERALVNHFIQLEPAWFFEGHIVKDQLPQNCISKDNFGLTVTGALEPIADHYSKARIEVLAGETELKEYVLDPLKQLKFYIGRSKSPQLSSGKIQQNDIVFSDSANLHVSRNHAYIVYDTKTGRYLLYPDKGGLPDNGNKLKVHTNDDKINWLNIYGVAHCLCDGDQVELGGEAVLRFRLAD